MSKFSFYSFLLCLALAPITSGCAAANPARLLHSPSQTAQGSVNWEAETFRYTARLRSMSVAELSTESETLQKAYANRRNEDNRLRLALFHAISPLGDRSRALTLLDVPPGDTNGRGRNHPLALLLLPLLQENRHLDDALIANQAKLRDEQKRSETLQQTNEQMRQKLEAIRNIEVKMLDRPTTK